jgi:hypothetical protein
MVRVEQSKGRKDRFAPRPGSVTIMEDVQRHASRGGPSREGCAAHFDVPHSRAGRPPAPLRRVRGRSAAVQLVPGPPLSHLSDVAQAAVDGRTPRGTSAGAVLPRGVHAAGCTEPVDRGQPLAAYAPTAGSRPGARPAPSLPSVPSSVRSRRLRPRRRTKRPSSASCASPAWMSHDARSVPRGTWSVSGNCRQAVSLSNDPDPETALHERPPCPSDLFLAPDTPARRPGPVQRSPKPRCQARRTNP